MNLEQSTNPSCTNVIFQYKLNHLVMVLHHVTGTCIHSYQGMGLHLARDLQEHRQHLVVIKLLYKQEEETPEKEIIW